MSPLAQADLAHILATSAERWGIEGRRRYARLLITALLKVAAEAEGGATRRRADLLRGLRSFHLRNMRADDPRAKVGQPVHILYYRPVRPGLVNAGA